MRLGKISPRLACGVSSVLLFTGMAMAQSDQPPAPTEVAALPDSPGFVQSNWQQPAPQNFSAQSNLSQQSSSVAQENTQAPQQHPAIELVDQSPASPPQEVLRTNNQSAPQRPVGTAAAEAPTVTGVTAAQPTGVAIAPAKQKRARSFVIKMGAMIGAGVAVGTVVALTAGTSSKPPGAH